LPSGTCVKEPAAKKGSACDANPCGECSEAKCVPNNQNSYGYQCVPAAKTIGFMSKSNGKFLEWKYVCIGRRRRRKCHWTVVPADKVIGHGKWRYSSRGRCKDTKVLKEIPVVRKLTECQEAAHKLGGKAISWKARYTRAWRGRKESQTCTIYKDYCKHGMIRERSARHYQMHMLQDRMQTFHLEDAKDGHFVIKPLFDEKICLAMGQNGPSAVKCDAKDKKQQWEVTQNCKGMGMLKNPEQDKCLMQNPKGTDLVPHACDSHYKEQQMVVLNL
jgi:hypothetical protein